jgi:hypothetical protein
MPSQKLVNLRVGKTVSLGGTKKLDIRMDALNALNANFAAVTTYASGPTFGNITSIPTPRVIQFGAQFNF